MGSSEVGATLVFEHIIMIIYLLIEQCDLYKLSLIDSQNVR